MKSCSDHVIRVPLQGYPKSECRLTCVRMQWVHWTNCALCPLLAVTCGEAGLALFTMTLSSPRMDYRWTLTVSIKSLQLYPGGESSVPMGYTLLAIQSPSPPSRRKLSHPPPDVQPLVWSLLFFVWTSSPEMYQKISGNFYQRERTLCIH
jgi:hypothetical protein